MNQAEARKLWLEAVERVKDRTLAPTLWRALELGTGVAAEDDFFIVGFQPSDGPMTGYLTSSEHRTTIEQVLTELVGKPTRIKIIDGTTPADYEAYKKREALTEETRRVTQERKSVERAAERQWEAVAEQCSRKYANTPFRQLPQIRAQYLFDAAQIILDAMDRIHPTGEIDEVGHRALARVVEKVATLADAPAVTVAAEVIRMRRARGPR
jgi:predicted NAD-dependent protein-ADP-ribosyltransferase YbiA (DUF1768 family)